MGTALVQARNWRLATLLSLGLVGLSLVGTIYLGAQPKAVPHIVQIDRLGAPTYLGPVTQAAKDWKPTDAALKYHLRRFITDTRTISSDVAVMRRYWVDAYTLITPSAANHLNATRKRRTRSAAGRERDHGRRGLRRPALGGVLAGRLGREVLGQGRRNRDRQLRMARRLPDRHPRPRHRRGARLEPDRPVHRRIPLVQGPRTDRRTDAQPHNPETRMHIKTSILARRCHAGCAARQSPQPQYVRAVPGQGGAAAPAVIEVPKPLPLPGQLQRVPTRETKRAEQTDVRRPT